MGGLMIYKNKTGKHFQTHPLGGTYPVSDGDPQNEVDDENETYEPDWDEIRDSK
jgi:hypothetical protein